MLSAAGNWNPVWNQPGLYGPVLPPFLSALAVGLVGYMAEDVLKGPGLWLLSAALSVGSPRRLLTRWSHEDMAVFQGEGRPSLSAALSGQRNCLPVVP